MEDYRFLDLTGIEVVISKMPVSFSLATPLAISAPSHRSPRCLQRRLDVTFIRLQIKRCLISGSWAHWAIDGDLTDMLNMDIFETPNSITAVQQPKNTWTGRAASVSFSTSDSSLQIVVNPPYTICIIPSQLSTTTKKTDA